MPEEENSPPSAEDASQAGASQTSPSLKFQAPEGLVFQELIAEAYKHKMSRLKRGSASGITGDFPSAASLFFEDTEVPPPPRLDFSQLRPAEDEALPRLVYLAHVMRVLSRDLLNFYLDECQAGKFGPEIAKQPDPNDEVFSAIIKEFACVNLALVGLEQIDSATIRWVQEYLDTSVSFLDNLVVGPPSERLMQGVAVASVSDSCREFTANLCRELGFGALGEPCWNFIYFKIKGAGQLRHDALQSSLTRSLVDITDELEQL